MNNYDVNHFRTYDLALAASLEALGFTVSGLEKTSYSNKTSFIFDRTIELDEAIQAYWSDKLRVNPKAYFDVLKHIKTRLYSGV